MRPWFRVVVSIQPPMPSLEHHGVSFGDVPYEDTGTAMHDLLMSVFEHAGNLALAADYRDDAYDAATVESLLHAVEVLLDGAVAQPDLPIAALPLVRQAEWARWIARCAGPGHRACAGQRHRPVRGARLATGSGGSPIGRTGFAPAG